MIKSRIFNIPFKYNCISAVSNLYLLIKVLIDIRPKKIYYNSVIIQLYLHKKIILFNIITDYKKLVDLPY